MMTTSPSMIPKKRITFAGSVTVDGCSLSSLPRTPMPKSSAVDSAYSDSGYESGCESTGSLDAIAFQNIPFQTTLGTLDRMVEKEALVCLGMDKISKLYGALSATTNSPTPLSEKFQNQFGTLIGLGLHFDSPSTGVVPTILSEECRIIRDAIPASAFSVLLNNPSPILTPDIPLPNPYGNTPVGLGITIIHQPMPSRALIGLGFSFTDIEPNTGTITTNPTLIGGNPVMQLSVSEPQDRKKLLWSPFFLSLKSSPLLPHMTHSISIIDNISVAKADGLRVPSAVVPAAIMLSATVPFTPLYTLPTPSPPIYGTLWDM